MERSTVQSWLAAPVLSIKSDTFWFRTIRQLPTTGNCIAAADRRYHAARTEFRNLLTSVLSRLLSPDSSRAAESTTDEAEPVSLAPRWTSVMLDETCWAACATCCTLRDIFVGAEPLLFPRGGDGRRNLRNPLDVEPISLIAATESCVAV